MIDHGPPYCMVPMPLDSNGRGPETNESKVVETVYQVWDCCNCTVFESPNRDETVEHLLEIQREHS